MSAASIAAELAVPLVLNFNSEILTAFRIHRNSERQRRGKRGDLVPDGVVLLRRAMDNWKPSCF